MIECRELGKRYGGHLAVDDLSFDVRSGAVTGFLGANGAGKHFLRRKRHFVIARRGALMRPYDDASSGLVTRHAAAGSRTRLKRPGSGLLPNATLLTVAGAGHTVISEKPDETGADAVAFLTGKPLPGTPYTAAGSPW